MNIRLIWRCDRYLRGSDHVSFQGQGYPAARFTEPRENFDHEHRNVEVINGVQFGDLLEFVDFDYVARVAKINAATMWALATGPGTPKNVQIHSTDVANVTTVTLDISKDNVQFGVRAVDQAGNRSPVAFPQAVA